MKKPKNSNYAASIVKVQKTISLNGCDNVHAAIIMGNQVIVSKDTQVGDIGLYFPLETQLSEQYLANNNLYRKAELNTDPTQKGYFEENGRIRCVKFKGHKSEGLFMPLTSLEFITKFLSVWEPLKEGVEFDMINDVEICRKYIPKRSNTPGAPGSKKERRGKNPIESKLIDGQFHFHEETNMLYKNLHKINPDDLISITYKIHGTSGISSYVLCKKNLSWYNKLFKFLGIEIVDTEYDYIYSSRKVIKNEALRPNAEHFYDVDIWGMAHEQLKPFLQKGMTFYYEIVGYLPSGGMIQKDYDYGYPSPRELEIGGLTKYNTSYGVYIYRITQTNVDGKVTEYSAKQVQNFCKKYDLNPVKEMFYGTASRIFDASGIKYHNWNSREDELKAWQIEFLEKIKELFNEEDCFMCINKVPEEGVVIRVESLDFQAYKQKSFQFYQRESEELDKNIVNIEDNQ